MAYPHAWIYACTEDGLTRIEYKDTEHYRVMREFLLAPDEALTRLLDRAS